MGLRGLTGTAIKSLVGDRRVGKRTVLWADDLNLILLNAYCLVSIIMAHDKID